MAMQNGDAPGKRNVKTTATGNAADTGTPVSIAPTKPPRIRFSDDFGGKGDLNYGRNRQNLPSSVEPGATVESDLAKDLRTTVNDPVLDAVQKFGTAAMRSPEVGDNVEDVRGTPATQIRDIAAKAQPAFGMKDPNANNPKIPSSLGASNGQPVRKPGA